MTQRANRLKLTELSLSFEMYVVMHYIQILIYMISLLNAANYFEKKKKNHNQNHVVFLVFVQCAWTQ